MLATRRPHYSISWIGTADYDALTKNALVCNTSQTYIAPIATIYKPTIFRVGGVFKEVDLF